MKITANLTKDFGIDVRFCDSPKSGAHLGLLYYGIIRAMKQNHNEAFIFALDKFIGEEFDEMMGDEEND